MKKKRGFASMSVEKRRAIASMGGKNVPGDKRSFSQDRTLAATAGRKGGLASLGGQGGQGLRKKGVTNDRSRPD